MKIEKGTMNLKAAIKTFKQDKIKNVNVILDVLKELKSDNIKQVRRAMTALHRIFTIVLKNQSMLAKNTCPADLQKAKEKYSLWVFTRYNEVHDAMNQMLLTGAPQTQKLALGVIMKLMQKEALNPISGESYPALVYPEKRLMKLLNTLISDKIDTTNLMKFLGEKLDNPELKYHVLKIMNQKIKERKPTDKSEIYVVNLFSLLEGITLPRVEEVKASATKKKVPVAKASKDDDSDLDSEEEEEESNINVEQLLTIHKNSVKAFDQIWQEVFKHNLPQPIFRRCLTILPQNVMHHLSEPILLTDFFMQAFALGGATSVLALEGIYILVAEHSLEYPNFYSKVYAMLEPTIFSMDYQGRFFELCYLFLQSPLVPEYYLVAFLKRASRLTVHAPSTSVLILERFAANLIYRYPILRKMIHKPEVSALKEDPYLFDKDPVDCRAGESSLWELATMNSQPLCGLAKGAAFTRRHLPNAELDMKSVSNITYSGMYDKASQLNIPEVSTTFQKPTGPFSYSDDRVSSLWKFN